MNTDFSKLPYNQLQQACKDRNLSAKGKTLELIARLEEYEANLVQTTTNTDTSNLSTSALDSMSAMLGVEITSNEENTIVSTTESIEPKKLSLDDIPLGKTEYTQPVKPIVSISKQSKFNSIRPIVDFDQDSAFSNVGYFCLNDNTNYYGEEALIVLKYLWQMFPVINDNIDRYTQETKLSIKFDALREIIEAKKIVKQGRNTIPSTVEYGKPRNIEVKVSADRGTIPGTTLPSESRQGFKTGIRGHIIDYKKPLVIKSANKILLNLETVVTKLPSQAYNSHTGKSREHKATSGYIGTHNTKTKISTGVKLSTSVQKMIDTSLLSATFHLPHYTYPLQLQITEQGNIILNEYHPSGRRSVGIIAKVTGIHYQQHASKNIRIFDWVYYDSFKNRSDTLDKQIRIHLSKCNKDVCYFLSQHATFEIKDDGNVNKMSRNKRKYIVKCNRFVNTLN